MKSRTKMRLSVATRCLVDVFRPGAVLAAGIVASMALSFARGVRSEAAPYCAELKKLNNYAMSRERFAPIIGQPRSGNYRETSLPLTGWFNCAFYGYTAHTCAHDS